jgi:hypothetical protein
VCRSEVRGDGCDIHRAVVGAFGPWVERERDACPAVWGCCDFSSSSIVVDGCSRGFRTLGEGSRREDRRRASEDGHLVFGVLTGGGVVELWGCSHGRGVRIDEEISEHFHSLLHRVCDSSLKSKTETRRRKERRKRNVGEERLLIERKIFYVL